MRIAAVSMALMALIGCQSTESIQDGTIGEELAKNQEVQNVTSDGNVDFFSSVTDEDFYPILKSGDWSGINNGSVYQVLIGSDEAPSLVIAYAADTEHFYYFLDFANKDRIDLRKAMSNAFKNLDNLELEFFQPDGYEGKVAVAKPDEFVSETLLSSVQMNKIHKILGTNEMLISIPTRTILAAIPFDVSQEDFDRFVFHHINIWNEGSNARISPELFYVEDGEVVTSIPVVK